jgi:hypothetical protein
MMQHEKIVKRPDGFRVRIKVSLMVDLQGFSWHFSVDWCKPGKRTWIFPVDKNCYSYRRLSSEDRDKLIRNQSLLLASAEEVHCVMVELWEKLRPSIETS